MNREAMQMALWTLEGWANHDNWVWPESALEQSKRNTIEAITALRQALETEQEPVAWMHNFIEGGISIGKKPTDLNRHPDRWTALYKDPTPCKTCQALAMAVMNDQTYHEKIIPKREWVGLTDEEIHGTDGYEEDRKMYRFVRAIEDRLKEKNT